MIAQHSPMADQVSLARRFATTLTLIAALTAGLTSLTGCDETVEGPVEQSEELDPLPEDY
ncbi:hypothetical protein [Alienimonas chondri]|uniref:Uncharacterized protein n=1 Tax=Alienimonas chondri TaxID=2681879 RepID=A0ABX1V770_9PLAN|nr:hypothetical protein [Alienimonas chondri]NNJ24089.1 hypothetical protein [Alienimonas chondri]